jgi:hypothetical protein
MNRRIGQSATIVCVMAHVLAPDDDLVVSGHSSKKQSRARSDPLSGWQMVLSKMHVNEVTGFWAYTVANVM